MRTVLTLLVLIGPPASADDAKQQQASKAELKKLEGAWEGYVVEGKGERPDQGPVHLRLIVVEAGISAVDLGHGNRDMGSGTCTIDPTRPMKELDATGTLLPGKRVRTFLGIYEVDGDTLRWCVDNRGRGRPTEFRSANGNYLLILKRKK